MEQKAEELEQARDEENAQLEVYKAHIRAMEENGKYTYLDIIFRCASLPELLTAMDQIGEIMEADKRLYDEYSAARQRTEEIKAEYEATLAELGEQSDELAEQKAALEEEIASAVELINELEEDLERAREGVRHQRGRGGRAERPARRDKRPDSGQRRRPPGRRPMQNNQQYTGNRLHGHRLVHLALPSSTYVTSRYGYRTQPHFRGPALPQRHRHLGEHRRPR